MTRFLLGALAMGAVFALSSFALRAPIDPAPKKGGPAWKVSDYQLDRAFRTQAYIGATPTTMQMPSTGGLIITQIQRVGGDGMLSIAVNGASQQYNFSSQGQFGSQFGFDLNPPIIARPNDTISFGITNSAAGLTVVIGGYATMPGET